MMDIYSMDLLIYHQLVLMKF